MPSVVRRYDWLILGIVLLILAKVWDSIALFGMDWLPVAIINELVLISADMLGKVIDVVPKFLGWIGAPFQDQRGFTVGLRSGELDLGAGDLSCHVGHVRCVC